VCYLELKIKPMLEKDVAAVVALECGCGLSSRGEEGYLRLLQDEQWLLLVARNASQITTEIIAIFSGLMVVDELQIDNIAVAEHCRRQGVAAALLTEGLKNAKRKGMVSAVLDVRSNNFVALKLYERHGFAVVGRRKDYYQNPSDDALLMTLNMGKHL